MPSLDQSHFHALVRLTLRAASAIMAQWGAAARNKSDGSPVTAADLAADAILCAGLRELLPGWGIISEESASSGTIGDHYVLVDPLDGTSEFVAGRDEFCISLGGISMGKPVWGLLCAPAKGLLWLGSPFGAERWRFDAAFAPCAAPEPLHVRVPQHPFTAMVSRSHGDPREQTLLAHMGAHVPLACGSALKFARIAEGEADFYPCLRPLHLWDIAGGHALLVAAGGSITDWTGDDLHYAAAPGHMRAAPFLASGSRELADQAALAMTSLVSANSIGWPK